MPGKIIPRMKATKLTKLRLEELSGVDDPANEAPGWIVAKSRDFKADIDEFEKAVVGTHQLLGSDELATYFDDAPEEVAEARQTILKHIGKDLEEVEVEGEEPKGSRIGDTLRNIFGIEKPVEKEASAEEPELEEEPAEEEPPAEEPSEEEPAEEEAPAEEPEPEEEPAEEEPPAEEPEAPSAEDVAKAVGDKLDEQLNPLRQALEGLIERTSNLEKAAARRQAIDADEPFDPAEESDKPSIGNALRKAASRPGRQVTLR